jgi:hypothetical protein
MNHQEEDFYSGSVLTPSVPKEAPVTFPLTGPRTPEEAKRFWRFHVYPSLACRCKGSLWGNDRETAVFESESFTSCRIKPLDPTCNLESHVLLSGDGTYDWTPLASEGTPHFLVQFGEFPRLSPPVSCPIDPTAPFTVEQTPSLYTITQADKVWFLLRKDCEGRTSFLTFSFSDIAWTVNLRVVTVGEKGER